MQEGPRPAKFQDGELIAASGEKFSEAIAKLERRVLEAANNHRKFCKEPPFPENHFHISNQELIREAFTRPETRTPWRDQNLLELRGDKLLNEYIDTLFRDQTHVPLSHPAINHESSSIASFVNVRTKVLRSLLHALSFIAPFIERQRIPRGHIDAAKSNVHLLRPYDRLGFSQCTIVPPGESAGKVGRVRSIRIGSDTMEAYIAALEKSNGKHVAADFIQHCIVPHTRDLFAVHMQGVTRTLHLGPNPEAADPGAEVFPWRGHRGPTSYLFPFTIHRATFGTDHRIELRKRLGRAEGKRRAERLLETTEFKEFEAWARAHGKGSERCEIRSRPDDAKNRFSVTIDGRQFAIGESPMKALQRARIRAGLHRADLRDALPEGDWLKHIDTYSTARLARGVQSQVSKFTKELSGALEATIYVSVKVREAERYDWPKYVLMAGPDVLIIGGDSFASTGQFVAEALDQLGYYYPSPEIADFANSKHDISSEDFPEVNEWPEINSTGNKRRQTLERSAREKGIQIAFREYTSSSRPAGKAIIVNNELVFKNFTRKWGPFVSSVKRKLEAAQWDLSKVTTETEENPDATDSS